MDNTFPPKTITVNTDDTILEFKTFDKKSGLYHYLYIHSPAEIKTGLTVPFTEELLRKFIKTNEIFAK